MRFVKYVHIKMCLLKHIKKMIMKMLHTTVSRNSRFKNGTFWGSGKVSEIQYKL